MTDGESKKVCECYSMVRKDFFDTALRLIEIEGEFPSGVAEDYLRAVENVDGRLGIFHCITWHELAQRREETGKLIEKVKTK